MQHAFSERVTERLEKEKERTKNKCNAREKRGKTHILHAYKKSHCNLHLALNNSNDTQFHFIHYDSFLS